MNKVILLVFVLIFSSCAAKRGRFNIPERTELLPSNYLNNLKVDNTSEILDESEREQLACLFKWAELESREKYNQTYGVNADSPAVMLFLANFESFNDQTWEGKSSLDGGLIFLTQISSFLEGKVDCRGKT